MTERTSATAAPTLPGSPSRAMGARPGIEVPGAAFTYLVLFRRIVVGVMAVGAVLAWSAGHAALTAAFVCVGVGELVESSYYLAVLRRADRLGSARDARPRRPGRRVERRRRSRLAA